MVLSMQPSGTSPFLIDEEGDCQRFDALVRAHERRIFSVCYRLLSDAHAAEDATQETFVAAWRHIRHREDIGVTWLLHVATNKCRDELRRRKRHPISRLEGVTETDGCAAAPDREPETATLAGHAEAELACAIARLPWRMRTCLVLADIEGLSYREIAAATGTGLGTVKSRLSRARRQLRVILTENSSPHTPEGTAPL